MKTTPVRAYTRIRGTACQRAQIQRELHAYKTGQLKTGRTHKKVHKRRQAIAIALSTARKKCPQNI